LLGLSTNDCVWQRPANSRRSALRSIAVIGRHL